MSQALGPNIEVENVFGISSSRLGSGFLSSVMATTPNESSSSSNSGPQSHSIINLQLGPCLTQWRAPETTSNQPASVEGDVKKSLERFALRRLHHDAITHLLPLTSSYCPLSRVTGSHYIASASYRADISIWNAEGREILNWNVYGPEFTSMDLPVNWMAYNPETHHLAVMSGPKNPSIPPAPATDQISPTLPKNARITVYNLSQLFIGLSCDGPLTGPPTIVSESEFYPNGEVLLAYCRPIGISSGMLAALIVDVKRDHSVVLFHKSNPNFEAAAIEKAPGGSVTYFSATPDGQAIVLLRGSLFTVYRPHSDATTSSPSLQVCLATKLFETDCSPFHWLDTTPAGTDFLTTSVRGQILHFRLSPELNSVELVRTVSSSFSGSLYHLIWNDQHLASPEWGELIRVGMFGLETERLPLQNRAPIASSIATTSNSLHNLTCCGIAFDPTGQLLAIGDWSGAISIWSTADHTTLPSAKLDLQLQSDDGQEPEIGDIETELQRTTITPKKASGTKSALASPFSPTSPVAKPKWMVDVRHSMVRALEWNRHPYNDGRKTIMIGDTSGRLLECSFLNNTSEGISTPVMTKISKTYRTITCMSWSPALTPNLFLEQNSPAQVWKCFLATGDSDGKLRIYGRSAENDQLKLLVKIQAHELMAHVTSRDIWTVAFSPCGRYIATGSEDYTVHVYRFGIENESDLELVQVLEGADAAVTCIDWQLTPLGPILISASDDRTIHCWAMDETSGSLQLFRIIRTNWEHLMITYACLEANGTRITCTTMSGYVYVFDLALESYRLRCKLHLGSIEGLAWNRAKPELSQVAVCSSDCTSTLIRIPPTPVK